MFSLFDIRSFSGTQARAWEELAYQVRPGRPDAVVEERKTRAPDGGVEWYQVFADGHHEGYQAKFYRDLAAAIGDMGRSVRRVASDRPAMTRLTFVVPFDFTDTPGGNAKSDQQRWDEAVERWHDTIPGASRLTFGVIRGGDVLAELATAKHAGRRAFWFGALELTADWFGDRWQESEAIAGQRYTPEAHTDVRIQTELSAVSLSPRYVESLDRLVTAATDAMVDAQAEWGGNLIQLAERIRSAWNSVTAKIGTFDLASLREAIREAAGVVEAQLDAARRAAEPQRGRHPIHPVRDPLTELHAAVSGSAARMASDAALAIVGTAGQGKTHSVLHYARGLLDDGIPALALLGQGFRDGSWWASVKDLLDVDTTADTFFGAFNAAAEATESRGLLMIDGLNESQNPANWSSELRRLVTFVSRLPWVSLVVTWRSDYSDVIDAPKELLQARHTGFAGVEREALQNYCRWFGIPVPHMSVFDPAFSTPLFLNMYCQINADDPGAGEGATGRSEIFARFAAVRAKEVLRRLRVDPSSDLVARAMGVLIEGLIASAGRPVSRSQIEPAINALLPHRTDWPNTLFGAMRSDGLIETTPSRDGEVVGFPFQAFSEHLVVGEFLKRIAADGQITAAGYATLAQAPTFWRSAAVLLPERFGTELVDGISEQVTDTRSRSRLTRVTLNSLTERYPTAFGDRAFSLLAEASSVDEQREALEVTLTLAPRLGHPANARRLHETLLALPMAERDATWSIAAYDLLEESPAYLRLVEWAVDSERHEDSTGEQVDEQIILAALPMVWTLTSPNRRLRDHTTKILVDLFRHHLSTFREVLQLFGGVNDPYVSDRLLAIGYGAVMRNGKDDLEGSQLVAEEIARWAETGLIPVHVLARDSARGTVAWAIRRDLFDSQRVDAVSKLLAPPYGATPATEPPTADELEATHGMLQVEGEPIQWRAEAILSSCLDWMGDFHRYVIEGDVHSFSLHSLDGPPPPDDYLNDPLAEVPVEWAGRWVAARAIELGWTAERFADFEAERPLSGSDAHKPERFGKKYQWLAHHELMARLADNNHPSRMWQEHYEPYAGPWTWYGRDIDPSLPVSENHHGTLTCTIADTVDPGGIALSGPDLDISTAPADWVQAPEGIPTTEQLIRPHTHDESKWAALYRHVTWSKRSDKETRNRVGRQQFVLQFSWLTQAGGGQELFDLLLERRLNGRWMPDRHQPAGIYLGEPGAGDWSPIQKSEPIEWEAVGRHGELGPEVQPASLDYIWEGSTYDCSLDETVTLQIPHQLLLGDAEWDGTRPHWIQNSEIAAKAVAVLDHGVNHTALLVDEAWLTSRLKDLDLEIVVGALGERHDMTNDDRAGHPWADITNIGLLVPGHPWQLEGPLIRHHNLDAGDNSEEQGRPDERTDGL